MSVKMSSILLHKSSSVAGWSVVSSWRMRRLSVGWVSMASSTREANFLVALVSLHQKPREGAVVGLRERLLKMLGSKSM